MSERSTGNVLGRVEESSQGAFSKKARMEQEWSKFWARGNRVEKQGEREAKSASPEREISMGTELSINSNGIKAEGMIDLWVSP
jgi:hypothetical protein